MLGVQIQLSKNTIRYLQLMIRIYVLLHIYMDGINPFSQGGLYNSLATVDDGSCVLIGCSDPNYAEYHTQGFIPNNSDDPDVIQTFDALFCNELAIFGCTNDYANNFNPDANVATDECEYGEDDYYDFSFEATEISMSIILPLSIIKFFKC